MALDKAVDSQRLDADLTEIADAIRSKSGSAQGLDFPDGFVFAINEISLGKEEQEKTLSVTQNGSYEVLPDEGKALSRVSVDVDVAFEGDIGKPYIDTGKITNFYYFCCNDRMNAYLDKLDTSNGTVFTYMFDKCQRLKTIPQIDTSRGATLDRMFNNCTALNTVPQLDTSNGSTFTGMFAGCDQLKTIPPLDTSKGERFSYMFSGCTQLETVSLTTVKADLSTDTFNSCSALKNITIGEGWAVNIYLHYSNNLTVESLHGMIENLADLTGQTAKTFQIGATNLAKIDAEHLTMLQNKNWNYS